MSLFQRLYQCLENQEIQIAEYCLKGDVLYVNNGTILNILTDKGFMRHVIFYKTGGSHYHSLKFFFLLCLMNPSV